MSFFVWKTSIQCKLNDIKTDIVGSHRERETNRYIRKTKQEANPSIVTTKERLEYYLKKKYNLNNDSHKMSFVEESTFMLKKLKSPIEKDLYAKYLSDLTNISIVLSGNIHSINKSQNSELDL